MTYYYFFHLSGPGLKYNTLYQYIRNIQIRQISYNLQRSVIFSGTTQNFPISEITPHLCSN